MEDEYFLTDRLGWRSVEHLRAGMGNGEFVRWQVYFARVGQRQEVSDAFG